MKCSSDEYSEFVTTCQAKGLPVPTEVEWEDFVNARDRMKPHEGYAMRMVAFANALAEDLPLPLKMTIFAPPAEVGLGLLRVIQDNFGRQEISVSGSSVFGVEPKRILLRNKARLDASPTPVAFLDEGCFFLAGAENDWTHDVVNKASQALAPIWKVGIRF